jgi:phage protein D
MAAAGTIAKYPVRHPLWELIYQGKNITQQVTPLATEITYTDKVEHHSDEIEIVFEDRERRWQGPWFPQNGDFLTLFIGYEYEDQLDCGDFQIDEMELKGPPDTFHLKCIAADITPTLRQPRSVGYEGVTLLDVAKRVAQRNGLVLVDVPQNVQFPNLGVQWDRITQRHENDLNFLHRLSVAHNYDFSIRGQKLIFYPRSPLEDSPTQVTVIRGDAQVGEYQPRYAMPMPRETPAKGVFVKSFEFKTKTQQVYRSASTAYQNPMLKGLIGAEADDPRPPGTGDDLHVVTRLEDQQQAQLKADSAIHDANMVEVTGRFETEGTIMLTAGINIDVKGFRTFDGKYHIEQSKHRLERSGGYTTEIEVRKLNDADGREVGARHPIHVPVIIPPGPQILIPGWPPGGQPAPQPLPIQEL